MIKLNLDSKRACIFGMPGEGKSTLLEWMLAKFGARAFVYDTMHEFDRGGSYDIYRPRNRYSVIELEEMLKKVVASARKRNYKLVAIDEANRFAPSKPHELPPILGEINDCCRHPEYNNFTPVFIARRPSQLNQDLTELAHYLFIFNLKGRNDIDYLNDFAKGLGDAVFSLPQYHFIVANQRREWQVCRPIKMVERTRPADTNPLQP